MKKILLIPAVLVWFLITIPYTSVSNETSKEIVITCSDGLKPLCDKWMREFQQNHSDLKFTILSDTKYKNNKKNILIISGDDAVQPLEWKSVIGRNIIVPVISRHNASFEELNKIGFRPGENFAGSRIYFSGNDFVRSRVAAFTGIMENDLINITDQEITSALKKDPSGTVFTYLDKVIENNLLTEGISFLPLDINANGKIDPFEDFYGSTESLIRGAWTGKFPRQLCSDIFITSPEQPESEQDLAFLQYLFSSGQDVLAEFGLCSLGNAERKAKVELLIPQKEEETQTAAGYVWLIITLIAIAGIISLIMIFRKRTEPSAAVPPAHELSHLDEGKIRVAGGVFYDRSHTWLFMEKDGRVRLGMNDFLHRVTGPLTRLVLKAPGEKISRGEKIFTLIQGGKKLEIFSPVSGTLSAVNKRLVNDPSYISSSPFEDGWIYLIEPSNWLREMPVLFMAEKVPGWLKGEISRVKDFFVSAPSLKKTEYNSFVFQDGGQLRENLLTEMGPEVWEDFQVMIIDPSI